MRVMSLKKIGFAFACSTFALQALAFPVEEMRGNWSGDATSAFYAARKKIPDFYTISYLKLTVYESSLISGDFGNGCVFRGQIIRSSASQYPVKGVIGMCSEKRMNGNFEGMFNRAGEFHLIVKEKNLGHADFYGKLIRHVN
jgi:hypothetical protein